MNQLLLERSTGAVSHQAFARFTSTYLIHAIHPASNIRFDGGEGKASGPEAKSELSAHQAGVNALVVDRFEGNL
jgi:DNA excision repair protein ERCC-8